MYAFLPIHGLTIYWSNCFYTGLSLLSSQDYVSNEIASQSRMLLDWDVLADLSTFSVRVQTEKACL